MKTSYNNNRLIWGCIFLFIGIVSYIYLTTTAKLRLDDEVALIEKETNELIVTYEDKFNQPMDKVKHSLILYRTKELVIEQMNMVQ